MSLEQCNPRALKKKKKKKKKEGNARHRRWLFIRIQTYTKKIKEGSMYKSFEINHLWRGVYNNEAQYKNNKEIEAKILI